MILVYRPELESPPMDKECTLSFSFIGEGGGNIPETITIAAGVNRNFSDLVWEKIKTYDVVQTLLKLGALRVEAESATTEEVSTSPKEVDTISDLPLSTALELVEASFDLDQLRRWDARESRIRVKNTLAKRIQAITEGNG